MTLAPETLEVRTTEHKGRGVFARAPIARGAVVAPCTGVVRRDEELRDDELAMQIGEGLWLCSSGEALDDIFNHSCAPNLGFQDGQAILVALRDIAPGEELCWDYSTSIGEAGWSLDCRCESPHCRTIVRSFFELAPADRARLTPLALAWLRSG